MNPSGGRYQPKAQSRTCSLKFLLWNILALVLFGSRERKTSGNHGSEAKRQIEAVTFAVAAASSNWRSLRYSEQAHPAIRIRSSRQSCRSKSGSHFFPFLCASSASFIPRFFREFFNSSYKISVLLQFCLSLRGTRTLFVARSLLWLELMISTRLCPPFSLLRGLLWISTFSRLVFPGIFVRTTSFQCVIGYN